MSLINFYWRNFWPPSLPRKKKKKCIELLSHLTCMLGVWLPFWISSFLPRVGGNSPTHLSFLSMEPYQRFLLLIIFLLPLFCWKPLYPEWTYCVYNVTCCQDLGNNDIFDSIPPRPSLTISKINSNSYLCLLHQHITDLLTIQWERFACSGFRCKKFLRKPLLAARARPAPNKISTCIKNLFIMQEGPNAASYYQIGNCNCAVWCLSWIFSFV